MTEKTPPAVIVKTRFSMRWRAELPSRAWIDERFELLKRVTLPSLRAQTAPEFDWVVLTDPDWYELALSRFGELSLPGGVITVVPARADVGVTEPGLLEGVRRGRSRFVTTRLDSDDALAPACLQRIAEAASRFEDGVGLINLPSGAVLDWESGELWRRRFRDHYQGPFYAVMHPTPHRMFDTGGDHRRARGSLPVVALEGLSWLQVIHAGNIDNRIVGQSVAERLKEFVKGALDAVSPTQLVIDDMERINEPDAGRLLSEFEIQRDGLK